MAFMRVANVPKRNLGQRRMAYLQQYCAEHGCTMLRALEATCEDDIFKRTKAKQLIALVHGFRRSCENHAQAL